MTVTFRFSPLLASMEYLLSVFKVCSKINCLWAYTRTEVDLEEASFTIQCQQWLLEVCFTDFFKPLGPL